MLTEEQCQEVPGIATGEWEQIFTEEGDWIWVSEKEVLSVEGIHIPNFTLQRVVEVLVGKLMNMIICSS